MGLRLGFSQSADDAFAAEHDHGVEERWRDGLRPTMATRVALMSRPAYAGGFGDRARGVVAGIMIPIGKFIERASKIREQLGHFRISSRIFLLPPGRW